MCMDPSPMGFYRVVQKCRMRMAGLCQFYWRTCIVIVSLNEINGDGDSDLLVETREIFIPHLFSAPAGDELSRRNFVKTFDADNTRMIRLPYGWEKLWQYVEQFSSNTGTLRTDGWTDRIPISISRVICWRAIKVVQYRAILTMADQ